MSIFIMTYRILSLYFIIENNKIYHSLNKTATDEMKENTIFPVAFIKRYSFLGLTKYFRKFVPQFIDCKILK